MRQSFIKDGVIRSLEVADGKVIATIEIGSVWVSNPTLEAFYADGWEDYIAPEPEPVPPYIPTLEELVEQKLRERYSINQEFEVQRKRDTDKEAFQEYYAYVEECIAWAKEQPHREDESNE